MSFSGEFPKLDDATELTTFRGGPVKEAKAHASRVTVAQELLKRQLTEFLAKAKYMPMAAEPEAIYAEIHRRNLFHERVCTRPDDRRPSHELTYGLFRGVPGSLLGEAYDKSFYQYLASLKARKKVIPNKRVLRLSAVYTESGSVKFNYPWFYQQINTLTAYINANGYLPFQGIVIDLDIPEMAEIIHRSSGGEPLFEAEFKEITRELAGLLTALNNAPFSLEVEANEVFLANVVNPLVIEKYAPAVKKRTNADFHVSGLSSDQYEWIMRDKHTRPRFTQNQFQIDRSKPYTYGHVAKVDSLVSPSRLAYLRKTGAPVAFEVSHNVTVNMSVTAEAQVSVNAADFDHKPMPEDEELLSLRDLEDMKERGDLNYLAWRDNPEYIASTEAFCDHAEIEEYARKRYDICDAIKYDFKDFGLGKRITHFSRSFLEAYSGEARVLFMNGTSFKALPPGFYLNALGGGAFSIHYDPLHPSVDKTDILNQRILSYAHLARQYGKLNEQHLESDICESDGEEEKGAVPSDEADAFLKTYAKFQQGTYAPKLRDIRDFERKYPLIYAEIRTGERGFEGGLYVVKEQQLYRTLLDIVKVYGPERLHQYLTTLEKMARQLSHESVMSLSGENNSENTAKDEKIHEFQSVSLRHRFLYVMLSFFQMRHFMTMEGLQLSKKFDQLLANSRDRLVRLYLPNTLNLLPYHPVLDLIDAMQIYMKLVGERFQEYRVRVGFDIPVISKLGKIAFAIAKFADSPAFQDALLGGGSQLNHKHQHWVTGYLFEVLADQYHHIDPLLRLDIAEDGDPRNLAIYKYIFSTSGAAAGAGTGARDFAGGPSAAAGAGAGRAPSSFEPDFNMNFERLVQICMFDKDGLDEESHEGSDLPEGDVYDNLLYKIQRTSFFRYLGKQKHLAKTFLEFNQFIYYKLNGTRPQKASLFPLIAKLLSGDAETFLPVDPSHFAWFLKLEHKIHLQALYHYLAHLDGAFSFNIDMAKGYIKFISLAEGRDELMQFLDPARCDKYVLSMFAKLGARDDINKFVFQAVAGEHVPEGRETRYLQIFAMLQYNNVREVSGEVRPLSIAEVKPIARQLIVEFEDSITNDDVRDAIFDAIVSLPASYSSSLSHVDLRTAVTAVTSETNPHIAPMCFLANLPKISEVDETSMPEELRWMHKVFKLNRSMPRTSDGDHTLAFLTNCFAGLTFESLKLGVNQELINIELQKWDTARTSYLSLANPRGLAELFNAVARYPLYLLEKSTKDRERRVLVQKVFKNSLWERYQTGCETPLKTAFENSLIRAKRLQALFDWVDAKEGLFIDHDGRYASQKQGLILIRRLASYYSYENILASDGLVEFLDFLYQKRVLKGNFVHNTFNTWLISIFKTRITHKDYFSALNQLYRSHLTSEELAVFKNCILKNQHNIPDYMKLISVLGHSKAAFRYKVLDQLLLGRHKANLKEITAMLGQEAYRPLLEDLRDITPLHLKQVYDLCESSCSSEEKEMRLAVFCRYTTNSLVVKDLLAHQSLIEELYGIYSVRKKWPKQFWTLCWTDYKKRGKDEEAAKMQREIVANPFGLGKPDKRFNDDPNLQSKIKQIRPKGERSEARLQAKLFDCVCYVNQVGFNKALSIGTGISEYNKSVKDLTSEEIKSAVILIKRELIRADLTENQRLLLKLDYLAIAREAYYRADDPGSSIKDPIFADQTQLLSVIQNMLLNGNMNYGIQTGEGKGVVSALTAACEHLEGRTVDLVTSHEHLAERDFKLTQAFYESLGIEVGLISKGSDFGAYKNGGVNIAQAAQMSIFKQRARLESVGLDPNASLIADEFDDLALDSNAAFSFSQELVHPDHPDGDPLGWLHKAIMKYVKRHPMFGYDETDLTRLQDINRFRAEVQRRYLHMYLSVEQREEVQDAAIITDKMLSDYLDAGYKASLLKEGDHYVCGRNRLGEEVIYLKRDTIDYEARYKAGVHQMLEAKHGLKVSNRSLHISSESPQEFIRSYNKLGSRIIGLTGTPGSLEEIEELNQDYGIETFEMPRRFASQSEALPPQVCRDSYYGSHKHLEYVVSHIRERKASDVGQPIVIFVNDYETAIRLQHLLASNGIYPSQLCTGNEDNIEEIIKRGGNNGQITIATNILGRGADIQTSHGTGLHIIETSLEDSARKCRQRQGRQGRNNQKGSTVGIYSEGEIGKKLFRRFGIARFNRITEAVHEARNYRKSLLRHESKIIGYFQKQCHDKYLELIRAYVARKTGDKKTEAYRKMYEKSTAFSTLFDDEWAVASHDFRLELESGNKVDKHTIEEAANRFAAKIPALFAQAFEEPVEICEFREDRKPHQYPTQKNWTDPVVRLNRTVNSSAHGFARLTGQSISAEEDSTFDNELNGLLKGGLTLQGNVEELIEGGCKTKLMRIAGLLANHFPQIEHGTQRLKDLIKVLTNEYFHTTCPNKSIAMSCLNYLRKAGVLEGLDFSNTAPGIAAQSKQKIGKYSPGRFMGGAHKKAKIAVLAELDPVRNYEGCIDAYHQINDIILGTLRDDNGKHNESSIGFYQAAFKTQQHLLKSMACKNVKGLMHDIKSLSGLVEMFILNIREKVKPDSEYQQKLLDILEPYRHHLLQVDINYHLVKSHLKFLLTKLEGFRKDVEADPGLRKLTLMYGFFMDMLNLELDCIRWNEEQYLEEGMPKAPMYANAWLKSCRDGAVGVVREGRFVPPAGGAGAGAGDI